MYLPLATSVRGKETLASLRRDVLRLPRDVDLAGEYLRGDLLLGELRATLFLLLELALAVLLDGLFI